MTKVTGIGGIFFRAQDPAALNDWYRVHLGITQPEVAVWMQEAGPTVFSPFRADSDYFAADRQWMLNLRVDDLRGLIARLAAAGIAVDTRADWDGDGSHGTFARIHDPEGTPIELWQPPD
ncbi:VOC family protein [Tabrizicola sp.]|uniref:VOC family protein n=1 Tax=Tabrizicola sp. TaxID=2005166 RepID=UPI0026012A4B|nr:VOC family protein [Tabrizicola sp.]MBY0349917.1 VOC family protein [Tabrizicola sp.]MDK2773969.1 VOC family protein [Tabrizicola sp.]